MHSVVVFSIPNSRNSLSHLRHISLGLLGISPWNSKLMLCTGTCASATLLVETQVSARPGFSWPSEGSCGEHSCAEVHCARLVQTGYAVDNRRADRQIPQSGEPRSGPCCIAHGPADSPSCERRNEIILN